MKHTVKKTTQGISGKQTTANMTMANPRSNSPNTQKRQAHEKSPNGKKRTLQGKRRDMSQDVRIKGNVLGKMQNAVGMEQTNKGQRSDRLKAKFQKMLKDIDPEERKVLL